MGVHKHNTTINQHTPHHPTNPHDSWSRRASSGRTRAPRPRSTSWRCSSATSRRWAPSRSVRPSVGVCLGSVVVVLLCFGLVGWLYCVCSVVCWIDAMWGVNGNNASWFAVNFQIIPPPPKTPNTPNPQNKKTHPGHLLRPQPRARARLLHGRHLRGSAHGQGLRRRVHRRRRPLRQLGGHVQVRCGASGGLGWG